MVPYPDPKELLKKVNSLGIPDAEVYFSGARTLSVEYSGKTCKTKEFSEDAGYGVRVLKNKKIGFSHTNIPSDFTKAVKSAEKLSKISPKTNFSFEPAAKIYPDTETFDVGISGLSPELAFSAIGEILEGIGKRAEPTKISISLSIGCERIANSEALSADSCYTAASIYAEAKKGRGLGFSLYSARTLPKDLKKFGEEAGKIACLMSRSKPIPTQKLTVRFSPHMLSSLLGFLMFNFDGDNKRRRITSLKKNQKKFSESFSLASDPLAPADALCPFDGEGVPSKPLPLIECGKVRNFLYDRYVSSLEGINKNGSCQRTDYASAPSPGITNLVVPAGDFPKKEAGRHLEVISFHGLHTSDPVSGDFGVDADIALLHEKGKTIPVTDVLITGNIFNMFNSIKHLGKTQSIHGNLISPDIWFSDVQIIGK